MKKLQWVLFLVIAIMTPFFALKSYDPTNLGKGIWILFAGISASLYVFCFVPYLKKYYLSELVILTISVGLETTLFVNQLHVKWTLESSATPYQSVLAVIFAIASLSLPFVTFAILEWRRPISERVIQPSPVLPSDEKQLRSARIGLIISGTIAAFYCIPMMVFAPSQLILGIFWIIIFGLSLWRYLKIRRELRAARNKIESIRKSIDA